MRDQIHTSEATVECRSNDSTHRLLWTVTSSDLNLNVSDSGPLFGNATHVNGFMYTNGSKVASFQADRGSDRGRSSLELDGHVVVVSHSESRTLTCDVLKWNPNRRLAIATGNVRYQTLGTKVGPFPEIWAQPDLGTLGTPDLMK